MYEARPSVKSVTSVSVSQVRPQLYNYATIRTVIDRNAISLSLNGYPLVFVTGDMSL